MVAVFTAADLDPDVKEAWHAVAGKDIPDTPRPPLADGEVKFVGACCACTVLLDGQVVTTVEGIAGDDGDLSPVQSAMRECHGLQCGFARRASSYRSPRC